MESRKDFLIPIGGLSLGVYQFKIDIDSTFVNKYDDDTTVITQILCTVDLTKASSHVDLNLQLTGWLKTACDRCLVQIDIPIDFTYKVLVKYDEEYRDDGDIVYLPRTQSELNIENIVFDAARLALPKRRVINCEERMDPPCDMAVLSKIENIELEPSTNDFWKGIKSKIQNK